MKKLTALTLTCVAFTALASGCVARMAVVSTTGKAYAVRQSALGTKMYYCEAPGNKPVCRPVQEI